MSCCNNLKGNCNQGRMCPVRRANEFPLATSASLKAPPLPPQPVEPVLVDRNDQRLHLARWLLLTVAAGCLAGAFISIFNK